MRRILIGMALLHAASPLSGQGTPTRVVRPLPEPVAVLTGHSTALGFPTFVRVDGKSVDVYDPNANVFRKYALPSPDTTASSAPAGSARSEIWIYAPSAETVNVFTTDHKLLRQFSVPAEVNRIVRFGSGHIAVGGYESEFAVVYDSANRPIARVPAPEWVDQMDRQGRAPLTAASRDAWAVAFKYTGRILVKTADSNALRELSVVESRPALPDTVFTTEVNGNEFRASKRNPASVTTVRAIAWSQDKLYALSGAKGETAGRYVDVYDGKTLTYSHSYLLPRAASDMIVNEKGIVTYEPSGKELFYYYLLK